MDRYQRVEKPKAETPIDENEIRITSQGRMHNYITYAMTLLQEKGSNQIVFKAMGRAINKTVTIVELIKRRIVGLHQITSIGSTDITDMWEPLEERLLPLETTRHVSMITITLSKKELNTSSVGYQPPLPADQVKESIKIDPEQDGSPNGRRRGRGGRGRPRSRDMTILNRDTPGMLLSLLSMRIETGIAILAMVGVEVEEEDVVSEAVDVDVNDTMDLRLIGWKMMATPFEKKPSGVVVSSSNGNKRNPIHSRLFCWENVALR